MRIAMISWESLHARPIGGVGVHVFELSRTLAQKGHEVHLFTKTGEAQALQEVVGGVRFHRIPSAGSQSFQDEVRQFNRSVGFYLRQSLPAGVEFDVIHCHDWLTFHCGMNLTDADGPMLAVTFHTTPAMRGRIQDETLANEIKAIEAEAILRAPCVTTVSQSHRKDLEASYDLKEWQAHVHYHGVQTSLYDQCASEPGCPLITQSDAPLAVFVGALTEAKRPLLFLDALMHANTCDQPVHGVLVGRGPLQEIVQNRIKTLGDAGGSCQLLQQASGRDIARMLTQARLTCVPYEKDPYGIMVLSSWAAQTPVVVAAGETAANEFVHHKTNGLISTPDADAYGAAMVSILADQEWANWLGRNGRVAVETAFSWQKAADLTLASYQKGRELSKE